MRGLDAYLDPTRPGGPQDVIEQSITVTCPGTFQEHPLAPLNLDGRLRAAIRALMPVTDTPAHSHAYDATKHEQVVRSTGWTARNILASLLEDAEAMPRSEDEVDCGWEGQADAQIDRGGLATWECPRCGRENETQLEEPEDDEDRGRDR